MLIATNGECTEKDYLDAIKEHLTVKDCKLRVKKIPHSSPIDLAILISKVRAKEGIDEVWGVCDVDEYDIQESHRFAERLDVPLVWSNPSFEVWLIWHLLDTTRSYEDGKRADAFLKRILPTWDKTQLKFADFENGVDAAVIRAKAQGDDPNVNPSSLMYKLIESIQSYC